VIASGSALALLFEIARESVGVLPFSQILLQKPMTVLSLQDLDLSIPEDVNGELLDILTTLANDTDRHKARKERTKQRATFRDLLRSIEVPLFFSFFFFLSLPCPCFLPWHSSSSLLSNAEKVPP